MDFMNGTKVSGATNSALIFEQRRAGGVGQLCRGDFGNLRRGDQRHGHA